MTIRNLTAQDDLSALLALNTKFEAMASPMDAEIFRALLGMAFTALTTADLSAFLVAFDQDAPYRNANFEWFTARHARFVYVDRIIVDSVVQGSGLALSLYETVFARARMAGHDMVCCEVNAVPPNPRSERFHARIGFLEVGKAELSGKMVRYLVKPL